LPAASLGFVDLHCHLLPALDDGAADLATALAMARMACDEGTHTIVATPHQCGSFAHTTGDAIRQRTAELQEELDRQGIDVRLLPGADVRIDEELPAALRCGRVLTLADRGRHVLLELPHEIYLPLDALLVRLQRDGVTSVLSHPERNAGLLAERRIVESLVDQGCLMQVTAGSLLGAFGAASQAMAEWMLARGLTHFLATDAHGLRARRPRLRAAYERARELAGESVARTLCCDNPGRVARGESVAGGPLPATRTTSGWRLFGRSPRAAG
jgi:protein-tyrosine phosphatase